VITKYDLTKASVARALRLLCRPVITGLENLPQDGPVIIASNHLSFLDSVIISAFMPRRVKFIAKAEYVNSPGIKGKLMREAFEFIDIIPVTRGQQSESVAALDPAVEHLKQGNVFGIYPEGTRSPDGRVYKGRTGLARIAMPSGVPVVLIGMIGSGKANPIGTTIPRPAKVRIKVSEPIDPRAWAVENGFDPDSREVMRPFTDYCMRRLAAMVGEDYVDVYASDVKKALEETGDYPEEARP